MKSRKTVFVSFLLSISLLTSCAAVRLAGKVSQATGDAMVSSANEEESKEEKKEKKTNQSKSDQKEQKAATTAEKSNTVVVKSKYSSVNVRPKPSTQKPAIASLKGGSEVEKIGESGDWVKIRFVDKGNKLEGWLSKSLID